jgi:hypothetical protein
MVADTLLASISKTGEVLWNERDSDKRRVTNHHYLKQSNVELNEAAFLLGFEDANSFYRAFQTWEGMTPGVWRTRHRVHAQAPASRRRQRVSRPLESLPSMPRTRWRLALRLCPGFAWS